MGWMAWQLLDLHDDIIATMLHMGTSCGQDDSKIHLDKGMKISQPTTGTKICTYVAFLWCYNLQVFYS